jgi:LPS sulfotransferase NodH
MMMVRGTRVERSYFVCATERSGSTLLCELLKGTGIAGRPEEYFENLRHSGLPRQPREYFHALRAKEAIRRLPPIERGQPELPGKFEARLGEIIAAATTPNGVFGAKLMWNYLEDFAARLAELPGLAHATLPEAIRETFPNTGFVHVSRADKVSQGVSLWKAIQSQQWRDEGRRSSPPQLAYDFEALDHLIRELEDQDDAWTTWFDANGIEPVRVNYEQLDLAPSTTIERTLDELAPDRAQQRGSIVPLMRRQADDVSADWANRYLDDQAQRAEA